jgi:hypothetical protein
MGFIELADSLGLADEKRKPSPLVDGAFSASSGSCEKIRAILLILSKLIY